MRELFKFYVLCLKLAYRKAWGILGGFSLIVGMAIAAILYFDPPWLSKNVEKYMHGLSVLIPISAFTIFIFIRIIPSPLWVYKERDRTARKIEAELKAKIVEKDELLDERKKRKTIREGLGHLLAESNDLMITCKKDQKAKLKDKIKHWYSKANYFLNENLDQSYIARFDNDSGTIGSVILAAPIDRECSKFYNFLNIRSANLKEMMKEFS